MLDGDLACEIIDRRMPETVALSCWVPLLRLLVPNNLSARASAIAVCPFVTCRHAMFSDRISATGSLLAITVPVASAAITAAGRRLSVAWSSNGKLDMALANGELQHFNRKYRRRRIAAKVRFRR